MRLNSAMSVSECLYCDPLILNNLALSSGLVVMLKA